jgi:outer membrane protein assembly factor BamE (lipoprotein component of BamABCDE complex)|tara:strand:+ start:159 stop:620 length:462 start_codon:yes stop_codon:yes gene_type:complete
MKYILILILFFTLSCSLNKVKNNHGVLSLENKISKIIINKSNTNDIINIFGPPSTKSTFDNNLWIYIERKKVNRSIFKLGNKKIVKNNVAILEIDNKGILKKKEIYDLNKMNKYKFSENTTQNNYEKNSYIYGVLTSLREKINAPAKRKKVSE